MTFGTDWGWGSDTDYIDLLYLHAWDFTTPVEEILRAMDDLVRMGKVLYVGISDAPAWQVSRMQAIADLRGWAPLIALQIEYSLVQRTVERDLIPMAREMGLGVIPWSPLASGVLTGKYTRADLDAGEGTADPSGTRKNVAAANGALTERALDIADVVKQVAGELGVTPSQVALAWTTLNPGVTAPIVGARTPAQLEDNLGALDVRFTESQLAALEEASRVALGFPHDFLASPMPRQVVFGGAEIDLTR
ncbi:aldo/keto reductase [Nonomuraea sp. 10N515B]|uniref:aldo/keto reductase n=1 Tax=Nonomuraea sp. 10N515B TaxID=3457422 RepID=UPI003FCD7D9A